MDWDGLYEDVGGVEGWQKMKRKMKMRKSVL